MLSAGALAAAQGTANSGEQTKSAQNQAKLEEDLNQFLNLLVTQLKNQDPLEPMDATEFTNQLVQFASVEQQIYQNSNLEKLLNAYHVTQVSNLTGYLGTTVESNGNDVQLENGEAKFTYELMDRASNNTIMISDSTGSQVATIEGEKSEGRHVYTWDGLDDNGNQLEDGEYTISLNPTDAEGRPIDFSQTVYNRVTGAGADEGEVTLYMGDIAVSLSDVVSVAETPSNTTQTTQTTQ